MYFFLFPVNEKSGARAHPIPCIPRREVWKYEMYGEVKTEFCFVLGATMFQYYIKIVPTTYVRKDGSVLQTNQFSVTKHQKV